ncbi:MAG: DUF3288 family protein [Cyanobacteria bacterium P01_F01_bin.153]
MAATEQKDQSHPQERPDGQIVASLIKGEPTDYNLAELARLRIRYDGFPGARQIRADLDKILQQWNLSEQELFAKTRAIHNQGDVYSVRRRNQNTEDWS